MLLPPADGLLGSVVLARIVAASRWSVSGEVVPAVPQMSTAERPEPRFRSDSPAYDSGAAYTFDCSAAEQPATCGDACECNGAAEVPDSRTSEAMTVQGMDRRLPVPGTLDKASIVPDTARSECSGKVDSAEQKDGDCSPNATQVPPNRQQAAHGRGAIALSSNTSSAADVRLHDSREAASSGAASAGAIAAVASAVTGTALAAVSALQQPVRSIVVERGSSAESAVRTAGQKEDFVDVLLALGVVSGLVGVLIVSAFDLIASLAR